MHTRLVVKVKRVRKGAATKKARKKEWGKNGNGLKKIMSKSFFTVETYDKKLQFSVPESGNYDFGIKN